MDCDQIAKTSSDPVPNTTMSVMTNTRTKPIEYEKNGSLDLFNPEQPPKLRRAVASKFRIEELPNEMIQHIVSFIYECYGRESYCEAAASVFCLKMCSRNLYRKVNCNSLVGLSYAHLERILCRISHIFEQETCCNPWQEIIRHNPRAACLLCLKFHMSSNTWPPGLEYPLFHRHDVRTNRCMGYLGIKFCTYDSPISLNKIRKTFRPSDAREIFWNYLPAGVSVIQLSRIDHTLHLARYKRQQELFSLILNRFGVENTHKLLAIQVLYVLTHEVNRGIDIGEDSLRDLDLPLCLHVNTNTVEFINSIKSGHIAACKLCPTWYNIYVDGKTIGSKDDLRPRDNAIFGENLVGNHIDSCYYILVHRILGYGDTDDREWREQCGVYLQLPDVKEDMVMKEHMAVYEEETRLRYKFKLWPITAKSRFKRSRPISNDDKRSVRPRCRPKEWKMPEPCEHEDTLSDEEFLSRAFIEESDGEVLEEDVLE